MSEAAPAGRPALETFAIRRPRAFDVSRRHSQRVQFLRRAIVVVCAAAIGLIGFFAMFDPLRRFKLGLTVGSVGLDGTKVTMHDPKLTGVQRNGSPYEIKAGTATQDTKASNLIELTEVDLRLGQGDGSTTRITARTGRYDTELDRLDLAGSVRFLNEGHYDIALEAALLDMRAGEITSERPATLVVPGGRIAGDAMRLSDGQSMMVFTGAVRSVFSQDGEAAPSGTKP